MGRIRKKRDSKYKRQITFDLKIEKLKKYYPRPEGTQNDQFYTHAYDDIRAFMKKHGFKHRLGSVYDSKEKITIADVYTLIYQMVQEMPWLDKCVTGMDLTTILSSEHDLLGIIKTAAAYSLDPELGISIDELPEKVEEEITEVGDSTLKKPDLNDQILNAESKRPFSKHHSTFNPRSIKPERE